jgi:hypothetical protein
LKDGNPIFSKKAEAGRVKRGEEEKWLTQPETK